MNSGHIILINGASGSGKTTLCRQLNKQLFFPYLHISIDRFYEGLPQKPMTALQYACLPTIYQGFLASIQAFAAVGNRVLLDIILTNDTMKSSMICSFSSVPTHLIGLSCPADLLEQRNRKRVKPRSPIIKSQIDTVHKSMLYDLQLDTRTFSPTQCADQVVRHLNSGVLPTALHTLSKDYSHDS